MSTPTHLAGAGAVSGYGWGFDALVAGLRSGVTAARHQVVDGLAQVAAVIPDPPAGLRGPSAGAGLVDPAWPRFEQVARYAVTDALADAAARGWEPGERVGVVFCTGIADIRSVRDNYFRAADPDSAGVVAQPRPSTFPRLLHTSTGSLLSQEHGWTGPNLVVNAACSSGNSGLALADSWLRSGVATDVILAGAELCLIAEVVTGFRRMRVLVGDGGTVEECRPFQEGSKRFFLGEAGTAFVVTRSARRPRATYLGGAETHDAFHLVAPDPAGTQLARCWSDALRMARARPEDVAVVKAHGSGTPINDGVELAVADGLFGPDVRLCTYKPLVGHCMAAAALVELAALLAGYQIDRLPGPVTADPADPRLSDGGPPPPGLALCGSVGLGGANSASLFDIPRGEAT
jgi:3-oxoacyl-[acyl-carrier-protein] synthase II